MKKLVTRATSPRKNVQHVFDEDQLTTDIRVHLDGHQFSLSFHEQKLD